MLGVGAVVGALLTCSTASATFPGRNGEIAFGYGPGDYCCNGIFATHPRRHGLHHLTSQRPDSSPSFSADGKRIVFARESDFSQYVSHIVVMDAAGKHVRYLTHSKTDDLDPVFSPNGRKIAFTRDSALYVMNADGTHAHRIVSLSARWPDYSPDGRRIVFQNQHDDTFGIFVVRANGSHARRLTKTPYSTPDQAGNPTPLYLDEHPRFSPDGKRIAFLRQDGWQAYGYGKVYVMRADGTHVHAVTGTAPSAFTDPTFSPDGRFILFTEAYQSVVVVRTDGSHRRVIAHGDNTYFQPDWQPLPRRPESKRNA